MLSPIGPHQQCDTTTVYTSLSYGGELLLQGCDKFLYGFKGTPSARRDDHQGVAQRAKARYRWGRGRCANQVP